MEPNVYAKFTELARITHEALRAYAESLGDKHQVPWTKLSKEQQKDAIEGVIMANKHRNSHPQHVAPVIHDWWRGRKTGQGWVKGEAFDAAKKIHPLLGPMKYMDDKQRVRTFLFLGVVAALAPHFVKDYE